MQEFRGRHLNPTYLKSLMRHGYAGARTMGSAFVENLWGWQVTTPHVIKSWFWDEVKDVYLDDKHGIGLDAFLAQGHNIHVRTNMQAVLLVAAHKGFWEADAETLKIMSEAFAQAVVDNGLPGSGHTRPDHPMMADVAARLDPALKVAFNEALAAAKGQTLTAPAAEVELSAPAAEVEMTTPAPPPQVTNAEPDMAPATPTSPPIPVWWLVTFAAAVVFVGGVAYGRWRR